MLYVMKIKIIVILSVLMIGPVALYPQNKAKKNTAVPGRSIVVDFNREKGPLNKMFNECIGAGQRRLAGRLAATTGVC
jgi:hypothetical protein